MQNFKAVLLDIEGTTTTVRFVYDTLFPFAREHVEAFLDAHWESAEVREDIAKLRQQASADAKEGIEGAVELPEGHGPQTHTAALANIRWHMSNDRKTTALKSLQGKIWRHGYATGELRADVFDDVPAALRRWQQRAVPVYIYSSGSVEAQKLLFGHTLYGDLQSMLSGYFDTTTGPKRISQSYTDIAAAIGRAPGEILFATDVVQEAIAAREAGLVAVIMDRPGNNPQPEHDFEVWADFSAC